MKRFLLLLMTLIFFMNPLHLVGYCSNVLDADQDIKARSGFSKHMYKLIQEQKFDELEKKILEFRGRFKPIPEYRQHLYFESMKLAEFYLIKDQHDKVINVVMSEIGTLPYDAPYPSFFLLQYFTDSFLQVYSKEKYLSILEAVEANITARLSELQQNMSSEKADQKTLSAYEKIAANFRKIMLRLNLAGKKAPGIKFTHVLNSHHFSFENTEGQVALLVFWKTTCGPSVASFPSLNRLFAEYENKSFIVVGVTSFQGRYRDDQTDLSSISKEEELELTQQFLAKNEVSWPVCFSEQNGFNSDYGVTSTPTFVLIDKKGIVRSVITGWNSDTAVLEKNILKLISED